MVLLLYGLSGSGKSTLAKALQSKLTNVYVLDGDILRTGLCSDLGFSANDRSENLRRAMHVARILSLSGKNVIVAMIAPYASDREMAREICSDVSYIDIFVDSPLEVCEQRDVKDLYKKARRGIIKKFTGVSDPFESPPLDALSVDTSQRTVDESAERVIELIKTPSGTILDNWR